MPLLQVNLLLPIYFSFLFSYISGQVVVVEQTFPVGIDGANPLVSAAENATNVSMYCVVTVDGTVFETGWRIRKDGESTFTSLLFTDGAGQAGTASENFMTTPDSKMRQNFTILVFDSSLDNATIGCGQGDDIPVTFDLKIIRLPSLIVNSTPQVVAESSMFSFSIESSSGFPLIPDTYQWSIGSDIIPIDSVNPNISVYPNITFTSVSRNDSGNYSISVTNEAGTTNGYFILDVQYGPEGVANTEGTRYVLVGTNVTIIGFSSIDGNPSPSSSWSLDGGSTLPSGGRFSTDINGQLSISSVQLSDSGNYTNTLMNTVTGQDMSINNTIELIVADGPSMPRSVTVLNVGADYVNISWINPTDIGTPVSLHQYTVTVESSTANTVSMNTTNVNINDPDYVNTLVIPGLIPNTLYTVTVHGTSTVSQLGNIMGDSSEPVSFNTTLGAPQFSSAVLVSSNGNLSVSWEFIHTGGGSISSITVQCFSNEDDEMLPASAAPLANIIECINSELCDNSTDIGPVTTGTNYSCIVTAENSIGMEDEIRTNYAVANTGLPSEAVIVNTMGGAGSASITVQVDNYGVTDPSQFFFTVTVYSNGQVVNTSTISPDSIDSPTVTLVIDNLPVGMLSFIVTASNIYGNPLNINNVTTQPVTVTEIIPTTQSSTGPTVTTSSVTSSMAGTVTSGTSTSTPMVSPTGTSTVTGPTEEPVSDGLSGGAIAGIVIAVIILLAIVALLIFIVVYLVYQSKGDSYKVEGGGKVKVEEHDIDIGTELKPTKPVEGTSENAPLASSPPRQELHYADLADFAPSKKSGQQATPTTSTNTAKPMPIEEVQYAVIRPQDQKKPSPSAEDESAYDNL